MKLLKIGLVVVVLLGAAGGVGFWLRSRNGGEKLTTAEVKRGDIVSTVSDVGTVEPRLKVEVKSKVAGRITDVLVDEGDWVEKGQTVALVDRTELERNLRQTLADLDASRARLAQARLRVKAARDRNERAIAQAEARLVSAKANLNKLRAGARPQELAQAESQVESSRIGLKDAEAALAQRSRLLKQGILRKRQAEAEVKALRASLAQLRAGARAEEVRSAEAAVQRSEATYAEAERELQRQKDLLAKGFVSRQAVDAAGTQVQTAAADLKRSKEQLALIKAGSRQEEIDAASARLERAEAELAAVETINEQEIASLKAKVELAKAELARSEQSLSLLKEGARAEEIEAAEAQVREAEVALQSARDGATDVEVAGEDVAQADAAVRRLEQTRDNVLTQLADTIIVAPIAGTVIDRAIDPGELVTSGMSAYSQGQAILTIADLAEMRIEARVNEVDVARLKVGQTAEVKVDALADEKIEATIKQISPSARAGNQQGSQIVMFDVLLVIPDPDPALKTGMSADVDVIVEKAEDVLWLPQDAIWKKKVEPGKAGKDGKVGGEKNGQWYARLITNAKDIKAWQKSQAEGKGKGKAKKKGKAPTVETKDVEIECGIRSDIGIEIKKGLKEGDLVRTDNIEGREARRKFEMKERGK